MIVFSSSLGVDLLEAPGNPIFRKVMGLVGVENREAPRRVGKKALLR
jgi:hypothetical protein